MRYGHIRRDQVDIDQARMARTRTRRRDWTTSGGSVDQAISKETGGCWAPSESGSRGDNVLASWKYVPEAAEEHHRLTRNDKLRRFVSEEDIQDRRDEFYTSFVEDGVDEDGYPEFANISVDCLAGPKFEKIEGSVYDALKKLLRKSPAYVIRAYETAEKTGRRDVLVQMAGVVVDLVNEGVYTLQLFQQTPMGSGFSAYQALKGYASKERTGDRAVAQRILSLLRTGQVRVA